MSEIVAPPAPLPPKLTAASPRRGRRFVTVLLTDEQAAIANGIASATKASRHSVIALAVRHGLGVLGHVSQAELWAMLPIKARARLRRHDIVPADRHELRERMRLKKVAKAIQGEG